MSDDLIFYTNPMSRGRIVRWMLEETGVPYSTEIITYGPQMKGADYLAINPMGKVPALVHGGSVITETGAICAYLADTFPDAGLAPEPGTHERGAYYRWMFFAAGPVEQATTAKAMDFTVPEDKRGMVGFGSLELVIDTLDTLLQDRDYILGDRFSACDIYLGSHIAFGLTFGTIETRPVFERYVAHLKKRPAFARTTAIDDALLAQMQKEA